MIDIISLLLIHKGEFRMKSKLLLIALIGIFTLTGCTISIGQPAPASSQSNTQNAANNQNVSTANNQNAPANNNQNATNNSSQSNQGSSDIGQTKTVGNFTIELRGVREMDGNDTSPSRNGKFIIVDAAVTNNGDETTTFYSDDVTLTDANGRQFKAQYSPYGLSDLNYVVDQIPGQSKVPRGVFVFDASTAGPYTLTINQTGSTPATWKIP
jgi:hypothetical protein